jgi:hypothetical protein
MYAIHYRRDLHDRDSTLLVIGGLATLEEANARRTVSGDLVVDSENRVVKDDAWLFEWEKKDPTCYARRAMLAG